MTRLAPQDFGRDTVRTLWEKVWPRMRNNDGMRGDDSRIGQRGRIQAIIDKYAEDGEIGVVESGRDCDCVSYCYGRAYPIFRAIAFQKMRDDMYEWADGPCNMSLCPPSELPESYSRDLALEAFEDGHPHSVSEVRYDEDGPY